MARFNTLSRGSRRAVPALLALILGPCAGCSAPGLNPPGPVAIASPAQPPTVAARNDADPIGIVEIPDPSAYTQVVALSDPHGMATNLIRLLSACRIITPGGHWLAEKTLLIVVGDSIDKGPQSLEILDLWRVLMAEAADKQSRLIVLLGNHEAEFLADPENRKATALRDELESRRSDAEAMLAPADPRGRLLRSMPVAVRIGQRWLFCHAGWLPRMPYREFAAKAQSVLKAQDYASDFLIGPESILEKRSGRDGGKWWESDADVRELKERLSADGLYGVVFGHQPAAFGLTGAVGADEPVEARLIKIDSGMAPDAGGHPGHLLIFPAPGELTANKRPAHILSAGFDDDGPDLRTHAL